MAGASFQIVTILSILLDRMVKCWTETHNLQWRVPRDNCSTYTKMLVASDTETFGK
jgi:hypothetical protein